MYTPRIVSGDELRALRRQLGWTQAELAQAMGVTRNTVARWEREELTIREPIERFVRLLVSQRAIAPKPKGRGK